MEDANLSQAIKTANKAAQDILKHRDRASWLLVGQGLYAIRERALSLAGTDSVKSNDYRNAQRRLMEGASHLAELAARDHAGCQHAVWMYENWDELKEWIDGLPPKESVRLNHPTSIHRRYNRTEPSWDREERYRPPVIEDLDDFKREYPGLRDELEDEIRKEQIPDADTLEDMYPHLYEEMADVIEGRVRNWLSKGIMAREMFDKLVVCLEKSTADDAPEVLELVQKLSWMIVREGGAEVVAHVVDHEAEAAA